jgi:hypothetical protein
MHTLFNRSLAAAAVTLAFAGAAIASQASKPATPSTHSRPAATSGTSAKSMKASNASHSAMGTIEKYDSNTLTLKTSSGEEQFTLASSAHVRNGSKSIKAEDLGSLTGQRAKVRYTESNGQRTAESVMVSSSGHKVAAKSKATKS